jgi:hypothetical protein
MTISRDPLEHGFELLKSRDAVFDFDTQLEDKLMKEMNELRSRPRRWRIVAAVLVSFAVLSIAGGVHAAGGFKAIGDWFLDVKSVEVFFSDEGTSPAVLMYDESGQVLGSGRLGNPDENGDYQGHILLDDASHD